jgi:uncharacterized protein (TIGR02001 family)
MSTHTCWTLAFGMLIGHASAVADTAPGLGSIHTFVRATSDYRVNGVSSSDRQPATQASIHWAAPHRFFLGAWGSTIDFNDSGKTDLELDLYAGKTFKLTHVDITPEIFLYRVPGQRGPDPTYNYGEARLRLQNTLRSVTLRSTAGWSPKFSYGAGKVWRVETSAMYTATSWLSFNCVVGRRWLENRGDRSHWEAGFALRFRQLTLDVRYVDTNLVRRQCGHADWCEAALVGSVTIDLPAIR